MTEQESIDIILQIAYDDYANNKVVLEALSVAMRALEKQTPKSWIRNEYFDGEYTWECPCCKEEYVLIEGGVLENGYSYCPNCGQKLEWLE